MEEDLLYTLGITIENVNRKFHCSCEFYNKSKTIKGKIANYYLDENLNAQIDQIIEALQKMNIQLGRKDIPDFEPCLFWELEKNIKNWHETLIQQINRLSHLGFKDAYQ
jgi:hypothetical protein